MRGLILAIFRCHSAIHSIDSIIQLLYYDILNHDIAHKIDLAEPSILKINKIFVKPKVWIIEAIHSISFYYFVIGYINFQKLNVVWDQIQNILYAKRIYKRRCVGQWPTEFVPHIKFLM